MFLVWLSVAIASPFSDKTMKGELAMLPLSGGLMLPKGRMSLDTTMSSKFISGYRDQNGSVVEYENTNFVYSMASLQYVNGFSKNINMYFELPVVWQYLYKDDFTEAIQTVGLGDVRTGIRFLIQKSELRSMSLSMDIKSPSGVEWPSSVSGYPNDISGFLTGTGTTNLAMSTQIQFKIVPNKYHMDFDLGYAYKFRSVVGYVLESDGFGNGRLKPGNNFVVKWRHSISIVEHVQVNLWTDYSHRGTYYYGTSGEGIRWQNKNELMLPTTFSNIAFETLYAISTNHSLALQFQHQIWGSDTQLFSILGLEEFSPQPGTTASLRYEVRW